MLRPGAFAEADVPLHEYATAGVRYDWFDASTAKADNQVRGVRCIFIQ